jgi:hypothetical protein
VVAAVKCDALGIVGSSYHEGRTDRKRRLRWTEEEEEEEDVAIKRQEGTRATGQQRC